MVLHVGDDDFVAWLHLRLAEGGSHKVDGFGGASGEDDLGGRAGIDKAAHALAGGLVEVGGLLRQVVHTTVYVCVDVEVLVTHSVEHAQGFLGSGGVVEIDERAAVHLSSQYGEVFTYLMDVVHCFLR